jgi:hypothetical protein
MFRSNDAVKIYDLFQPIESKPLWLKNAVRQLDNTPLTYGIDDLHALLSDANHVICEQNGKPTTVLRFLLRTDGTLVFGKEGGARLNIPSHFQMADLDPWKATCITAGNAYFDENQKLVLLDNKSGDFRPPFDTLQFATEALLKHPNILSNSLMVDAINTHGNSVDRHLIDISRYTTRSIFNFMRSLSGDSTPLSPTSDHEEDKAEVELADEKEKNEAVLSYQAACSPIQKPLIEIERTTLFQLKEFITGEIQRIDSVNCNTKGRDDKSHLYGLLLAKLNAINEGKLAKNEIGSIIRECAIIAHHQRNSKLNTIASLSTFGLFTNESDSWAAWKKQKFAPHTLFNIIYQRTLAEKEGRSVEINDATIDNYNDYRKICGR